MPEVTSILLVGVGGQGTILVSSILSKGLVAAGHDVKMSEIHGMAQRGGSVSTQVRFGDKVWSPIVGRGGADIVVAFEVMEAARWLPYLKPGGKVIVNDMEIPPAPVLMGRAEYPKGLLDVIRARFNTTVVNARRRDRRAARDERGLVRCAGRSGGADRHRLGSRDRGHRQAGLPGCEHRRLSGGTARGEHGEANPRTGGLGIGV
jgi:indolepyruvate ferredoxin oxidoreductase beta subunit